MFTLSLSTAFHRRAVLTPVAFAMALICGPVWSQGAATSSSTAPAATTAARAASGFLPRQSALTLKDAVQKAVLTNPEVLSRWHAIQAAEGERDAARGALYPRLDVNASSGVERRSDTGRYNQRTGSVSLSQLLYDGFATYGEYRRLDHAARARMYEFFENSETIALEAARAYLDVARYRELVFLAEDNYVEHRAVFAQTERRVRARVARGVDLEQISGRLALAEANLVTETANLHDTTARFLRIIGVQPPAELSPAPTLASGLPASAAQAVAEAQMRNPTLLAAMETVRASQAALDARSGANGPRVDLRLRRDYNNNPRAVVGDYQANTAEVVVSWNLFNGLSDVARSRQFAGQLNTAKDIRDKTCRDINQTLLIAYNDVQKLKEQLEFLIQHQTSIGKALVAYRQQFDIGQRTLLDLLDTENELFQAKRAVVNARQDLHLAYVRTHAGLGTLLPALELQRLDAQRGQDMTGWNSHAEPAQNCPMEPVAAYTPDKPALLQRAAELSKQVSLLNARERALAEATVAPAAANPPSTAAAPLPPESVGTGAAAVPAPDKALREALEAWRSAWTRGDVDAYLRAYADGVSPNPNLDRAAWEAARRSALASSGTMQVEVTDLRLDSLSEDRASTVFTQRFSSDRYRDVVLKTLQWQRIGDAWRIVKETSVPAER